MITNLTYKTEIYTQFVNFYSVLTVIVMYTANVSRTKTGNKIVYTVESH